MLPTETGREKQERSLEAYYIKIISQSYPSNKGSLVSQRVKLGMLRNTHASAYKHETSQELLILLGQNAVFAPFSINTPQSAN